jgi:pentapeptide MXKDX repeat protein
MTQSIRNVVFGFTFAVAGLAAGITFAQDAKSPNPMSDDAMHSGSMTTGSAHATKSGPMGKDHVGQDAMKSDAGKNHMGQDAKDHTGQDAMKSDAMGHDAMHSGSMAPKAK